MISSTRQAGRLSDDTAETAVLRTLWVRRAAWVLGICLTAVTAWILWAPWPDPKQEALPWVPDAIVALGGGDEARGRKCLELAQSFPQASVVVTGDGGTIVRYLRDHGVPESRIVHEELATSTVENARFTQRILNELDVRRVVLVTNWFHAPRSLAVFRSSQPERSWAVAFETKPDPLTRWDKDCQRRERVAALYYFLTHGIWSF